MVEVVYAFFDEFLRTFRIVDVIDVLVVSVFLYSALLWFKQAATRGVLIGVAALAAIYFVARALDMYLTSLAFQTTFAVLLFALIVVFQEDLRRVFDRLSAIHSVRLRRMPTFDVDLDGLVESAFKLASMRTGALIVLTGRDPLERHLDSGIELHGKLSRPLLYSIFDATSPGHDGAVIIDRNRIEQFGAHLPISKNRKEISGRGTRHSAALGIAERTDSLTIVVSEERGVVSVAEHGKLSEAKSPAALKSRLEKFLVAKFPRQDQSIWKAFIFQHGLLKLLALLFAVAAWFLLAYDPSTIQRTFVVPIEYRNVPASLYLDQFAPSEARVTLSGSERHFRFLDPGSLTISVDVAGARLGLYEIVITEENLRIPASLDLYRIAPSPIRLFFRSQPPEVKARVQSRNPAAAVPADR